MGIAVTVGFWILVILATLVVTLAILYSLAITYLARCVWVLTTSLPIGTRVSFDEIQKLGLHWIATVLVLDILIDMRTISTRFVGPPGEQRNMYLSVNESARWKEPDEPPFNVAYPQYFEYMLHRRPRRRHRWLDLFLRRKHSGSLVPQTT
jgi:hypothetical protein